MADTSVVVQLSAQDAELVAAWQRARRGPQGMAEELENVRKKGRQAGSDMATGFTQAAAAFTGVGSAMGAALKLSQLVRAEWVDIINRMREAAGRQQDVNQSFRRAVAVSGSISPNELFERVVLGANGVEPKELFQTFEGAVSAAGDISPQSVLDTVLQSARLAPQYDTETRKSAVSAALIWQKEFNVKPEEALAGVMQSFVADRTDTAEAFAKNIAPAVAQLHGLGGNKDSFEFLLSELIGFGQRAGDPMGRRTANNYINLARQYKEHAVVAGLVDKDSSLQDALEAVRGNPKLQQKMLGIYADTALGTSAAKMQAAMRKNTRDAGGDVSVEARTFQAAVETLQSGQGDYNMVARERRSALSKLKGLTPAAVAEVEEKNKASADSKYSVSAGIKRAADQAKSEAELLDLTGGGKKSTAIDKMLEVLRNTSSAGDFSRLQKYGAAYASAPFQSEADVFGGVSRELRGAIENQRERGTPASEAAIGQLSRVLEAVEKALLKLESDKNKPQQVIIAGDQRADVPQRPAAGLLNDRFGGASGRDNGGASGSW